jgi:hypothetical protein
LARATRASIVLIVVLSFATGPGGGPVTTPPAEASTLREVRGDSITALVPAGWRARGFSSDASGARGLLASRNLERWSSPERREPGVEAYWIDAASIGVPSDYYYLAAEGPAMSRLPQGPGCRRKQLEVLRDRRPRFDRTRHSPGDYVATAGGACGSRGRRAVWAAFVAAPGFGPVGSLGIPQSGLYYAMVVVPDGPRAHQRAERLLSTVRFGEARVGDLIAAARGQL